MQIGGRVRLLWVKSGPDGSEARIPLFPNQRTFSVQVAMSQKCQFRKSRDYSITSSARARSIGGTLRPSAVAVLRLIDNLNFVGCSTGKSLGSAPLRILPTYTPIRL